MKARYIPSLDGWRAVAIVWVILSHNQPMLWGGPAMAWVQLHGDRGVQLFFALSGILICSRLLLEEEQTGAISLKAFYVRRTFRIQPAALTYLGLLVVLTVAGGIAPIWPELIGSALMVRNYWPHLGPTWSAPPVWYAGHFWSLAVEEHFYLFLPGFLVLCRRWRLQAMTALFAASVLWFHWYLERTPGQVNFFRTDLDIGEILLGCAFALALQRQRVLALARSWMYPWAALAYMVAVFTLIEARQSRVNHTLLLSVFPILVTATMLHPRAWTTRLLELRPIRFVGRISYSLYLWQQLFFCPYRAFGAHDLRRHGWFGWGATTACAVASYYLVETPLVRRGHGIAKRIAARQETAVAESA